MASIENELKRVLAEKYDITGWKSGLAGVIAEKVGKVDNPQATVQQLIEAVFNLEKIPPEIATKGEDMKAFYFQSFNYNTQKQFLLDAVESILS